MFTFIVVVFFLWLYLNVSESEKPAASRKSKQTQNTKTDKELEKQRERHSNLEREAIKRVEAEVEIKRQKLLKVETNERDQGAEQRERGRQQYFECIAKERAEAEVEYKRQQKLKGQEEERKRKERHKIIEQARPLLLQSITNEEWENYQSLVSQALAVDHKHVHCIYCRETKGIKKRGRTESGVARYFCTSCGQAFQSEYKSHAKKMSVSLDKQQRDIRSRIQCKVRSKIQVKIKSYVAEQVIQSCSYSVSDTPERSCIEVVEPVKLLSTTAYAKTRKLRAKPHLFNYLCQNRVIKKVDGKYELTDTGRSFGGQYRTGRGGNKWIVWPENALDGYVTQLQQRLINSMPFDHLCHMTHIDNLAGIVKHGLQPHLNEHKLTDISNSDVNVRRQKKETVNSKSIHSYVPFYFNARNAMLFQVQKKHGDKVVILGYEKSLICHQGSVYSDGNAASDVTKFFDEISSLYEQNWREVFSSKWATHGNVDSNLKRRMMSEALIPGVVQASELRVIYCASLAAKRRINRNCSLSHVEIIVAPSLFF